MVPDVLHAAVATTLAEISTLPIALVKARFQNQDKTNQKVMDVIRHVYSTNGVRGFYKASLPAVASQVISTSSKWYLYNVLNKHLNISNDKNINRIFNGAISGVLTSFLTHPFDFTTVHCQMNVSSCSLLKNQVQIHGPLIFYRGFSKSIGKILVGNSLIWSSNDFFKDLLSEKTILSLHVQILLASFASSVLTTVACQPFDFMKTRHMYGLCSKLQGWNPLYYYKGFSLNLMRNVPNFVITMGSIEYLRQISI